MTSEVKLKKIDQLIEKFFYNGFRQTNSVAVRVTTKRKFEEISEGDSEVDIKQEENKRNEEIIQDDQMPSTSKISEEEMGFSVGFLSLNIFLMRLMLRNDNLL